MLLSPPLHRATEADMATWVAAGKPVTALVPELDDFLRPPAARERFAPLTHLELVPVEGAKHLWVGETYVRIALDEIVARVAPGRAPLPTTVDESLISAPSKENAP